MKTKKYILLVMSIIFIFNSCKKGVDDPFISFRSRDNRLIGKWKLEEIIIDTLINKNGTETNNVNNDIKKYKTETKRNYKFDNNNLIVIKNYNENYTTNTLTLSNTTNTFEDTILQYYRKYNGIEKYLYSVSLEINKDNTWFAEYSKTLISKTVISYSTNSIDTILFESFDTTYISQNTNVWKESGVWIWRDSKKNKIIIDAGPMQGKVKRLSNKEIIIEDVFSFSNNDSYTKDEGYVYHTFDDVNNPTNFLEGVTNSSINSTQKYSIYCKWITE